MEAQHTVTDLLHAWSAGEEEALDELMALVYGELKAQCSRALARERADHTLQPTALLNEVYLRLLHLDQVSWESRSAFFGFAAGLMRRILVSHAREVRAAKRGGSLQRVELDLSELPTPQERLDILDLDRALHELEKRDPMMVKIIELRFFAGMTEREIATALAVSRSSVQREWRVARRWLASALDSSALEE